MPSEREFKATLGAWANKVDANLDALARQSVLRMSRNVVQATPVDTGFLRGSWQPAIGAPAAVSSSSADQTGVGAMSKVALTISGIKPGVRFFMTNNARYAMRLEFGFVGQDSLGRTYNQQGRFYVGNEVKRWPLVVEALAKELKLA